jgi:hypothetical protein
VDAESEQPSSGDRTRPESQILSVAKRFLCGQLGVIAASRELSLLRHEVETELAVVLMVFTAIDSETDTLPIGDVRQQWGPEVLEHKNREIIEAENFYRKLATEAATRLLLLLEKPS